jgi:hypothetical protein
VEEYTKLRESVAAKTAAERADELTVSLELKSKNRQLERLEEQTDSMGM